MVDDWILTQHRSMARWVSTKVGKEVGDLTKDLADGIVLIDLLNKLIEESGVARYVLTPVYTRPRFSLQKIENIDDFLKFCRLVLKINTCNISAEDIVGGNLKLILGLIWTLFVFLFSLSAVSNDSRSIGDIKTILLRWINTVGRSRALPEVSNFNKDWSLQQGKRPDLIFASILDYYSQDLISFDSYVAGKRYANLESIFALAESQLGIPSLAEPQDFNVLVPDEKCLILYLLQWYLSLQNYSEETSPADLQSQRKSSQEQLSSFIGHIVTAVKYKNKYETKALRFLNQINSNKAKIDLLLCEFEQYHNSASLIPSINAFCQDLLNNIDIQELMSTSSDCVRIIDQFNRLFSITERLMEFRTAVKPILSAQNLPEIQALFRSTTFELKLSGISSGYEPFKLLSLPALVSKFEILETLENKLSYALAREMLGVTNSNLQKIDLNIDYLLKNIRSHGKEICDDAANYADNLDQLLHCRSKAIQLEKTLCENHTIEELRALISSIENLDVPDTPDTPKVSEFMVFKDIVEGLNNQKNLTFYDLKQFFKTFLSLHDVKSATLKDFMKLIPTRKLLTLSESDDFSGLIALDDSDHSVNIFDKVLQTLEYKLSGTHNRLYDLGLFVDQLENGFCIHY